MVANVAAFHEAIVKGDCANPTAPPSVQSTLLTIMGRHAAYEHRLVTWQEIVEDRQQLSPNLEGLRD